LRLRGFARGGEIIVLAGRVWRLGIIKQSGCGLDFVGGAEPDFVHCRRREHDVVVVGLRRERPVGRRGRGFFRAPERVVLGGRRAVVRKRIVVEEFVFKRVLDRGVYDGRGRLGRTVDVEQQIVGRIVLGDKVDVVGEVDRVVVRRRGRRPARSGWAASSGET
jgi:hypothetical protein